MQLLAKVRRLAEEVETHTAARCRSAHHYIRARRCARSFLTEARSHQGRATFCSVRLHSCYREIQRLIACCGTGYGQEPSSQQRRALKDLREAERLLRSWATSPDVTA